MKSARNKTSLVAAIDFGTTYSGCAYSFRETFEKNPLEICINDKWSGPSEGSSVPTSVLLNEKREFHSFGYQAEEEYAKLALNKQHHGWYLFRQFKMTLHNNKNLARNTEIEDEEGRKMMAVDIFSMAIKDISNQLLINLNKAGHHTRKEDIDWVLTVPAIWTEAAKQFMQLAATMAGIPIERLTLALEPEAAAVFCKELTMHKRDGQDGALLKAFDPGSQYLVLDFVGGTVDDTIQEVLKPNADLKILDKANGGDWGGVTVDKYFLQFIKKLVGIPLYLEFAAKYPYQKMKFEKHMESCKRKASPDANNKIVITIPSELTDMYKEAFKKPFDDSITQQTHFHGKIKIIGNEMVIESSLIQEFYDKTIDNIIKHVWEVLKRPTAKGVSYILLVGGFAESSVVEHRIRKSFEGERITKVIVPREAGLAIVKGAVIYGHNSRAIAARVSPYTYGVETRRTFDPNKHPANRKKEKSNHGWYVDKVFDKHIIAGQTIYVGNPTGEHLFYQINPKKDVFWRVFRTEHTNPTFTDEYGCEDIGKLSIKLEGLNLKGKRSLAVRMTCQGTVLEAEATDKDTRERLTALFDFLG